nr:hypothetical protein [Candidatus Krumholzibacteria bacterium]
MKWRGGMLLGLLIWGAGLSPGWAQENARLLDVIPGLAGDTVICHLRTQGLPGEKQLQTMQSGLESAVEFKVALLDEEGRPVVSQSLSLRMGFDLWDEVFSVRMDGRERRFQSLTDLKAYLAELESIPVTPAATMRTGTLYRVQVGLVVHTLAPAEQKRVEDVIVGSRSSRREGQDAQEASVSLGRLIRLFYKGSEETRDGQGRLSAWFTRTDLFEGVTP